MVLQTLPTKQNETKQNILLALIVILLAQNIQHFHLLNIKSKVGCFFFPPTCQFYWVFCWMTFGSLYELTTSEVFTVLHFGKKVFFSAFFFYYLRRSLFAAGCEYPNCIYTYMKLFEMLFKPSNSLPSFPI